MINTCPNKPEHPTCPRLPHVEDVKMIKCANIVMSNGNTFMIKEDDLVGIQFIRPDNQIIVRRGRIKDFKIVNKRELSNKVDNLSHIILDCSEQFSVKILEIKLKDIIAIGSIETEFEDYSDRITQLAPNVIEGDLNIPVREGGMVTQKEHFERLENKPNPPATVVEVNADGTFKDLNKPFSSAAVSRSGFPLVR